MKLICFNDYIEMPWKNGMGTTLEIDKAFDASWRLSTARVSQPSPFSEYVGYRRLLTVWQGAGLLLNRLALTPGQVHEFDGAEKIFCKNLSAEVTDVGFMYRGDQFQAEMKHLLLDSEQTLHLKAGINFLFCAKGEFQSGLLTVKVGDTLKFQNQAEIPLKFKPSQLQLIHIYLGDKSKAQPGSLGLQ